MKKTICILIADRNPNVREFLKRELKAEGYQIMIAGSSADVVRFAYASNMIDAIIVDPDLPGDKSPNLIQTLRSRIPALPVIIHSFGHDRKPEAFFSKDEIFVEKRANSIEQLKKVLQHLVPSM